MKITQLDVKNCMIDKNTSQSSNELTLFNQVSLNDLNHFQKHNEKYIHMFFI